jgi:hypothetical protein
MGYTIQEETFESIWDEWERILPSCSTNTVFVTPWWQKVWWNNFSADNELHILSIRDGDELIGIASLMISDGTLTFAGDKELFDYLDFLVPKGNEARFYGTLFDHIMGMDWQSIDLPSLPHNSPTLEYVPRLAKEKGLEVDIEEEETTPVAYLPESWDEYLAGLRKKDRHELRRKIRRLEAADSPRQYSCNDPDCMQDFFRLLRASRADKDAFLTPEREKFFLDIAEELSSRDQFKLYFLEVNGERVAGCICFDYGESYLLYNSGYDPAYSQLSVGLLNKALSLQTAIEEGRQSFNFLKGNERYKYNLGGKDEAVYHLTARR